MINDDEFNTWIHRVDETKVSQDPPWLAEIAPNGAYVDDENVRALLNRLYALEIETRPGGGDATAHNKDMLADQALAEVSALARYVAGWALNHKRGCALRKVAGPPSFWQAEADSDYLAAKQVVDHHSYEEEGARTSPSELPPDTARRFAIDVLQQISLGFDLPPTIVEGLIALDFGETTPVLSPVVSSRKRQYRELQLQLRAISFVEYERAKGFKKYEAQQTAASVFGVGADAIRVWEYRLRKELGNLQVRSTLLAAARRGRMWKNGQRTDDPMTGFLEERYGHAALASAAEDYKELLRPN